MVDKGQQPPAAHTSDPREIRSSELVEHGHIGVRTYTIVFVALMLLLAITVAAAQVPFAEHGVGHLGIVITFLIAAVKAVLVVVYFMHVRYSTRLTKVFVVAGLLWLGILFALTLNDYLTRGWLPLSSGWEQSTQIARPPARRRPQIAIAAILSTHPGPPGRCCPFSHDASGRKNEAPPSSIEGMMDGDPFIAPARAAVL